MASDKKQLACAIYTRKSSEEGLEQEFNSLDAQREACEAFILSQRHEGWKVLEAHYDDGGFSGGNMGRPALQQLLEDVRNRKVDVIVVYKVDRLTRSLADFAKIVEVLDAKGISFVSVTQQFNTTTSMGRLTLNVLLSFAQFEREVTGERIRDKIAASKRKGMWMGGVVPIGYDIKDRRLVVNEADAETVRTIFRLYRECKNVRRLQAEMSRRGIVTRIYIHRTGRVIGGKPFFQGHLYGLLKNRLYLGEVSHKGQVYQGQHDGIIDPGLWQAVQDILAANVSDRRLSKGVKYPSLLAGLIFDDRGNRLTPSHSQRGTIRHRYYASQALLKGQVDKIGEMRRLPAQEIEGLVKQQITQLFKRPTELIDHIMGEGASPDTMHTIYIAARKLEKTLEKGGEDIWLLFTRSAVRKVVVGPEQVEITLDRRAIKQELGLEPKQHQLTPNAPGRGGDSDDEFAVKVDAHLKRCGRQKRLLISKDGNDCQLAKVNTGLVKALTRAFKWEKLVRSGLSMQQIAKQEGLNRTYVTRLVRLAFLAPDIVENIVEGRQAQDLKIKTLFRNLPMDWTEQRRVLGFPAH